MVEKYKRKGGKYVEYKCIVCGGWYIAKNRAYKHTCSYTCSMARMTDAWKQQQAKEGPIYDKWREHTMQGLQHFYERMAREAKQ